MTKITIFQDKQKEYIGFEIDGHAGFADAGEDIVCAAISALVITTMNSIEELTDDFFGFEQDEKTGYMSFSLDENFSKESELLLQAMVIGLTGISKQYDSYCKIVFEEV